MTALPRPSARVASAPQGHRRSPLRPVPGQQPRPRRTSALRVASQAMTILAMLALSFVLQVTVLGGVRYARDQVQGAAELRVALAGQKAPVSSFDDVGRPLAAGTPVAILEIPRIGVRQVVVEGTTASALMSGPGHRRDTPLPGQGGTSVIAGRRAAYGGPFRSIDELRAGDTVAVTTGQGRSSFEVLGVRRAGDPLPPPLSSGQGRLTLVTADGPAFGPTDILRVDAQLTSDVQPAGAVLPVVVLSAAEAAMAGEPAALSSAAGWAVLLSAAAAGAVWVRFRVGLWQAWVIGVPVLLTLVMTVAKDVAALLPNVL